MRRMGMLLGLTVLTVMVAAGIAMAVNRQCGDNLPCRGTDNDDVLHERVGNREKDRILGLDGKDDMEAALFRNDRDRLDGGRQGDRILTNDGDRRDAARGGRGRDTCLIDQGDANSSCEVLRRDAAGALPQDFGQGVPADESTDPEETTSP
jgi:hypothetical protein